MTGPGRNNTIVPYDETGQMSEISSLVYDMWEDGFVAEAAEDTLCEVSSFCRVLARGDRVATHIRLARLVGSLIDLRAARESDRAEYGSRSSLAERFGTDYDNDILRLLEETKVCGNLVMIKHIRGLVAS